MSSQSTQLEFTEEQVEHVSVEHDREIKDPVHGYIPVSKLITSIIDTPQFQRLRYLKQLGTAYYVWPGATHNRFEHSLGVFNLASTMVNRLRKAQPALNITNRDVRCVEVAGLCHDLGHGPFSHVWDGSFIPTAMYGLFSNILGVCTASRTLYPSGLYSPGCTWKHEDASEMMLDYLVQENNIDLKPDEVAFIKDIIAGSINHTAAHDPPEKPFLFEIVANKRNGIDVDKFDYIARDSYAVSGGSNTDLIRLVNSARVINGEICYSEKNATTVYGLFQERFKLHKTIYQHKTAKSIQYMVIDALLKADPYLKISERIHQPRKFMYLNDDILNEVERSEAPELAEARRIIHRIRTRDVYRIIDKKYVPWASQELWRQSFTPSRIVEIAKGLPELQTQELKERVAELRDEHIIVDVTTLHHGMCQFFPLDNCKFYGKYSPNDAFAPRREDISHLLPKEFGEVLLRVFARDGRYFGVIQMASRTLFEMISSSTTPSTPPEIPATPCATSSMSSITETVVETPAPVSATPRQITPHNVFMTVPPNFTPVPGTPMTRSRKRGAEATAASPTKKRKA